MESRNKALSQLRKTLRSGRGEDMPDMKKVSIIAPDEKGLKEGLKKAEEILPKISSMASEMEPSMDEESPDHESTESKDMESSEDAAEKEEYMKELEGKSIEDLKQMIVDMKCEQKEVM
jgi:hypothetical protein